MIKITLDNQLLKQIVEIENNKTLLSTINVPINLSNRYRKNSRKTSAFASNKIEGNPLTYSEASEVIESKNRHYIKAEQEIKNYFIALEYLETELKKKTKPSIDLILNIQKIICDGESKEKIGLRGQMPPGVLFAVFDDVSKKIEYIPPEYVDILPLLNELIDYINNSDDHPIIKAAITHYQLVTIHPFEDGNGRTARIISSYILEYFGYGFNNIGSLEEYFAYDINEYYNSLQMNLPPLYYEGRNNPPHPEIWINYFLRMMKLYSNKILEVLKNGNELSVKTGLSHLKNNEKELLYYLINNDKNFFTPIDISRETSISNRTIINRLSRLVENGFVVPNIINKRIRSYSLTDYAKNIKKTI